MDYNKTLNLPHTGFPMRANLAQREPAILSKWEDIDLYNALVTRRRGCKKFIIHDGPTYANPQIRIGQALNKILKDIIIKYKSLSGYWAEFIPGWDCYGLPIEYQVEKNLRKDKERISIGEKRLMCRAYAANSVDKQKKEFQRLGVLGDWENSYQTMSFAYEAGILREFGRLVESGTVYKGTKPVYWCINCKKTLAEAEIEYAEQMSTSTYVKFQLIDPPEKIHRNLSGKKVYLVIWTTMPWTILSNQAVALHPKYYYVAIEDAGEVYIVKGELAESFAKDVAMTNPSYLATFKAAPLERLRCRHPFLDRDSIIVLDESVALYKEGTGCVHIAPGHGREEHNLGLKYGMDTCFSVDEEGRFTAEVPSFKGMQVFEANLLVITKLKEVGALLREENLFHSSPHCWCCKQPVICRATMQWFISMDETGIRNMALQEIGNVRWIPSWGQKRMEEMIADRPDWCISRQRTWGVPIAIFRCMVCGHDLLDRKLIDHVAEIFESDGADAWFNRTVEELLLPGSSCPSCSAKTFEKGTDIFDVFFDSGVSYAYVCEGKENLGIPVDLYLEGSDQYRGWLQTTLLLAVGTRKTAPYKAVLTHGFVLDGSGQRLPILLRDSTISREMVAEYGADLLRLWLAAVDYRNDVQFSKEILERTQDAYRIIRNRIRFMLGNLDGFFPQRDTMPYGQIEEIDRYMLILYNKLIDDVHRAYDDFKFHIIFRLVNSFFSVDLSRFYFRVLKDRLYCSKTGDPLRRSAQTAIFEITRGLLSLLAPILSFTSEEAWEHLPDFPGKPESIFLYDMPISSMFHDADIICYTWKRIRGLCEEIAQPLEIARKNKVISADRDAIVTISPGHFDELFKTHRQVIREALIVSDFSIGDVDGIDVFESKKIPGLKILVEKAPWPRCKRCWNHTPTVGTIPSVPDLCNRCIAALEG